MRNSVTRFEAWLVRSLCAIALVFIGFAHQAPAVAFDPTDPAQFAQFVLPDGTLPTLCVTVTDADGKTNTDHKFHNQGCEACRIGASVLLPAPSDIAGFTVAFGLKNERPRRVIEFHRQLYPPNTGPRAPPSDPTIA
jgi:hypothetical protein